MLEVSLRFANSMKVKAVEPLEEVALPPPFRELPFLFSLSLNNNEPSLLLFLEGPLSYGSGL